LLSAAAEMSGSDGQPLTLALWVAAAVVGFSMAIYGAVQPVLAERKAAAEAERRREQEMGRRLYRPGRGVAATSDLEGSYFTGRVKALGELAAWLSAPAGTGDRTQVVTGGPGSGKSAVLGRLVLLADPTRRSLADLADAPARTFPPADCIHAVVHARGKTIEQLAVEIAERVGLEAGSPQELVEALRSRQERLGVVLDALDEALQPEATVRELVRPLARGDGGPEIRLLVGTRPHLLKSLAGVPKPIDLDAPKYWHADDMVSYVQRSLLLAQDPATPTPYRDQPELAAQVAAKVAAQAGYSFLVAQLVCRTLTQQPTVVDMDQPGWERFPHEVGEAMDGYLAAVAELGAANEADRRALKRKLRDLLIPLAYAEGAGLDDEELWAVMATATGTAEYRAADVRWLQDQPAVDLLHPTLNEGRTALALFHQELGKHLRSGRDDRHDQDRYTGALIDLVRIRAGGDWAAAPRYVRDYLATHAARAGRLDELLGDIRFLLAADPDRLLLALPTATTPEGMETARVYPHAVRSLRGRPPALAAAYLQLRARRMGANGLAEQVANAGLGLPWSTRWVRWQQDQSRILNRHLPDDPDQRRELLDSLANSAGVARGVEAVAAGEVDGDPVAISASSDDAILRVWDLHDGRERAALAGHTSNVDAVAIGQVDGDTIAVSGDREGVVRVWDLRDGTQRRQLQANRGSVNAIAIGQRGGTPVVAVGGNDFDLEKAYRFAGGASQVTVHVWDLRALSRPARDGETTDPVPLAVLQREGEHLWAVAFGEADEGPIVVAADSHTVRVWDLDTSTELRSLATHEVSGVALAKVDGRQVAVLAGHSQLQVWDLRHGDLTPMEGSTDSFAGVAVGRVDHRPVAVTADADATVGIWDLTTATEQAKLKGHSGFVTALTVTALDGRPIAVTGGEDRTIRVWDLLESIRPAALAGPAGKTKAIAVATVDGKPVMVAAGLYTQLWVWDQDTGHQQAELEGHTNWVWALATGHIDGQPMLISGGDERAVRIWDLRQRCQIDALEGHRLTVFALALAERNGHPVAICTGNDPNLRVWDLATQSELPSLKGHSGIVMGLAAGKLDGRWQVVSGAGDTTVRVWDLDTGTQEHQLVDHEDQIPTVALGTVDGHPTIVSGSWDETVRVWDLQAGTSRVARGHVGPVQAVALGNLAGHPVVASGGVDETIRVWDLHRDAVAVIEVEAAVTDLAITSDGALAVATNQGVLALHILERPS
jgi:WD40 repeat protein